MPGLLTELNELLSTEYQLDVNGISNNKISYVRVPRTQSDPSFLNSKEWVDTAIEIAGSKQSTFESAKRITNHIIRYYRDSFLAACEIQRVPISKPMSATKFQAMLRAGRVSGTGKRELKKHLSAHLGKGFCPTRRSDKMEDWVERQHQWGMRQRRRFRNVQDPLVRALAREKATSCNTHPDVLAQVDVTDTGNKQKCSEKKADVISTRQKLQRDVGRFQAIKYFIDTKEQILPLAEV